MYKNKFRKVRKFFKLCKFISNSHKLQIGQIIYVKLWKMLGIWIWTLFSWLTNLNWVNKDKCAYGILLNSILEWICKWLCKVLLLNGIGNTLQLGTSHYNIDHVIVHSHLYWSYVFHVCPDRSGARTGGHPLRWRHRYRTSSARKATPLWSCR